MFVLKIPSKTFMMEYNLWKVTAWIPPTLQKLHFYEDVCEGKGLFLIETNLRTTHQFHVRVRQLVYNFCPWIFRVHKRVLDNILDPDSFCGLWTADCILCQVTHLRKHRNFDILDYKFYKKIDEFIM